MLVGDHHQLAPLVRSQRARKDGLDVSLFSRLCEAHPEAVAELAMQYRMNADIMELSNELVYGGRLKCGNGAVAEQRLKLFWDAPKCRRAECLRSGCWLDRLVNEECVQAVHA